MRRRALDRDASDQNATLTRDFGDFPLQLFLSTESFEQDQLITRH